MRLNVKQLNLTVELAHPSGFPAAGVACFVPGYNYACHLGIECSSPFGVASDCVGLSGKVGDLGKSSAVVVAPCSSGVSGAGRRGEPAALAHSAKTDLIGGCLGMPLLWGKAGVLDERACT